MLVFGKNVANEVLDSKEKIKQVYIQENFKDEEILKKIKQNKLNIHVLSKFEMDKKISGLHQGVILEIEDYKYAQLDDVLNLENPLLVILDHIEDPHNFGAIIRTCEAAGVDGIIIPSDRSVEVNGTVVKTSVGTTENVRIIRVINIAKTMETLKKKGFWIVGTDMNGEDYTKIDYRGKIAIVCGNEGKGMSHLVEKKCDFIASIPMNGTVNSLNASVATGIILFEAIKIRKG